MSQQLVKKKLTGGYENVMPKSWIEAIKDKNTGQTLVEILQGFNMYFLPYNGNTPSTRCLVPTILRKKGLWITYVKYDGNVYTEWYAANEIDDKSWGNSSNWRIGNNTLVGDITISANGNWVINGTETEFKAIGEKGNTPLIRVANNRLQVSYDLGDTYRDVTNNPVYTKFRWLGTTGDTQANNVGRIQASTDEGKTWTNMSNDFTNNLHISRYIGANESLPTSGIAEGTIYAKGPTYDVADTSNANPIYRLWVYAWKGNTLAWQDNGEFTSITAGIVQETGDSENAVMSQKATSEAITLAISNEAQARAQLEQKIYTLDGDINGATTIKPNIKYVGWYIPTNGGSVKSTTSDYIVTDNIPLKKGQKIVVTSSAYGCSVIAKMIAENNYQSLVNAQSSSGDDKTREYTASDAIDVCVCGDSDIQVVIDNGDGGLKEIIKNETDRAIKSENDILKLIIDDNEESVEITNNLVGYVNTDGQIINYAGKSYRTTQPFSIKIGQIVHVKAMASGVAIISTTDKKAVSFNDILTPKILSSGSAVVLNDYEWEADTDTNVVVSYDSKQTPTITIRTITNRFDEIEKKIDTIDCGCLTNQKYIKDNYPYYLTSEWDKKGTEGYIEPTSYNDGSYLDNKIRQIPKEGKTFAFVTDTHIDRWSGKSTMLIDYVRKRNGFNNVIFGGDCVTAETTKYLAAQMLSKYADEFYSAFGTDGIWVQGNHDANAKVSGSTEESNIDNIEIYNRTVKYIENKVVFDTSNIALLSQLGLSAKDLEDATYWMMMHYYYDDDINKVRYIVLEMGDRSNGRSALHLANDWAASHIQLDFLAQSLLSVPIGYNVVVSGHQIGSEYGINEGQRQFIQMLSAYKAKTSYSLTKNSWYYKDFECVNAFNLWQLQGGKTHTYNFANANVEGTPVVIGGHWHWDDAFICHTVDGVYKVEEYDEVTTKGNDAVLVIWTSCDMHPASPYTITDEWRLLHVTTPTMVGGTITEHCFDVVTVTNNKVVCTRFGAGNDRVFII